MISVKVSKSIFFYKYYKTGFSLRAFEQGSLGLSTWSTAKRVLDNDSGVGCFKEVKTTAKILVTLAF